MLDEILNNPDLTKYHTVFKPGQIIFLEGDDSQDLYILVSGRIDIFKGDKKIRQLTQRGSLFGEVSFFLGSSRTASVKAQNDVTVVRIPKEKINHFLAEFPNAAREITTHLAKWLDKTSQILHGLEEFCDQLPDAVITTDREGKILAWNSAAEKLYGRQWQQMINTNVDELYEDPQSYRNFLKDAQSKYSVKEKSFKIRHPQKGIRFISTNMTVLYDGHHNFTGVLSLGRDVTKVIQMERKYKRIGYWFFSVLLLLAFLSAAIFIGHPYFSKSHQTTNFRKQELRNNLAKDYLLLQSLLIEHIESGDRKKTSLILKNFFKIYDSAVLPYTGVVLLDKDRKVVDAYSINSHADLNATLGSSYAAIEFRGSETSGHKVLTLYRKDKNHPMGKKGVEIAFELHQKDAIWGWLVFQMDMDVLKENHGIDTEGLEELQFEKP